MTSLRAILALGLALTPVAGAFAQALPVPDPAVVTAASRRFPQPVRAGDLAGRRVLAPHPEQPVLGTAGSLVRRPDGGANLLVNLGSAFEVGTRLVAVPVEGIALLGEHVASVGYSPEQLRALPTFSPGTAPAIADDQTLRIGIVRPFH